MSDESFHLTLGDGAVTIGVEHLESLFESILGEIIGKFTDIGEDSLKEGFGLGLVEGTRTVFVKVSPEGLDGLLDHFFNFRHVSDLLVKFCWVFCASANFIRIIMFKDT